MKRADSGSAPVVEGKVTDGIDALASRYRLDRAAVARLQALLARISTDDRAPTTDRSPALVLDRHIADSLAGLEIPRVRAARRVADLGSGAGLPGIVLAIALPGADVQLVESRREKCSFLASLAAELSLSRVRVVCSRAEDWAEGRGRQDLVVARALARQAVVMEYAAPLLEEAGTLVEWRGDRDAPEEARSARAADELGLRAVEVLRVTPFEGASGRHLHVFERSRPTPPGFPRRAGIARRRPLGN